MKEGQGCARWHCAFGQRFPLRTVRDELKQRYLSQCKCCARIRCCGKNWITRLYNERDINLFTWLWQGGLESSWSDFWYAVPEKLSFLVFFPQIAAFTIFAIRFGRSCRIALILISLVVTRRWSYTLAKYAATSCRNLRNHPTATTAFALPPETDCALKCGNNSLKGKRIRNTCTSLCMEGVDTAFRQETVVVEILSMTVHIKHKTGVLDVSTKPLLLYAQY